MQCTTSLERITDEPSVVDFPPQMTGPDMPVLARRVFDAFSAPDVEAVHTDTTRRRLRIVSGAVLANADASSGLGWSLIPFGIVGTICILATALALVPSAQPYTPLWLGWCVVGGGVVAMTCMILLGSVAVNVGFASFQCLILLTYAEVWGVLLQPYNGADRQFRVNQAVKFMNPSLQWSIDDIVQYANLLRRICAERSFLLQFMTRYGVFVNRNMPAADVVPTRRIVAACALRRDFDRRFVSTTRYADT
jgi:hypothetical protein